MTIKTRFFHWKNLVFFFKKISPLNRKKQKISTVKIDKTYIYNVFSNFHLLNYDF